MCEPTAQYHKADMIDHTHVLAHRLDTPILPQAGIPVYTILKELSR